MEDKAPPIYNVPPPLLPNVPAAAPAPAPAPRQPRRRSSVIATVVVVCGLVIVVCLLLLASFTGYFSPPAKMSKQSGRYLDEVLVDNNNSRHKIAVIDVEGIITSAAIGHSGRNMVDLIEDQLELAADDDAIKAVLLKVDSPGGEVMASDDIARAITAFQTKAGKPIIAAMGGLAASGGYYVSVPCQWIVANELTITGSIGVIMQTFNYRGLLDKVGMYPQVFKSGRFKDMMRGSKKPEEVLPEERQMIQDMVDETFTRFKTVVAKGRQRAEKLNGASGRALSPRWQEFADGRILTGTQALEHGFVDELGNFDTAVEAAKKIAGITNANVVRYQPHFDIGDLFSLFGKSSEARTIKLDVGLDLPKLEAGRLYFLSPTVLH